MSPEIGVEGSARRTLAENPGCFNGPIELADLWNEYVDRATCGDGRSDPHYMVAGVQQLNQLALMERGVQNLLGSLPRLDPRYESCLASTCHAAEVLGELAGAKRYRELHERITQGLIERWAECREAAQIEPSALKHAARTSVRREEILGQRRAFLERPDGFFLSSVICRLVTPYMLQMCRTVLGPKSNHFSSGELASQANNEFLLAIFRYESKFELTFRAYLLLRMRFACRKLTHDLAQGPFRSGSEVYGCGRTCETTELVRLPDTRMPTPEAAAIADDQAKCLQRLITDHLTKRQLEVVRLAFGLDGEGPYALTRIAALTGISEQRVGQLKSRALAKLKSVLAVRASPEATS